MRKIQLKLTIFILIIILLFSFSCKSTGGSKDEPAAAASGASEDAILDTAEKGAEPPEESAEGIAAADEEIDVLLEELFAELIERNSEESVSEPAPVVTAVTPPPPTPPVPPPAPVQTPPVPPPAQVTPPQAVTVQEPEPEPDEIAEEPAPVPVRPDRSNIPDYPATRLDSPAQMGMTPLDREIIYSRIVRASVGQTVEIPFRGNGWVYLGEIASRRGIVYNSRRNESDGQSFIFSLEEAGVYTLRFYRQDFIRDFIINDHIQVVVTDAPKADAGWFSPPSDRGKVVAQPRWPSPLEEAQIRSGVRLPSEPVVSAETTPSAQRAPSSGITQTPQRTTPSQSTPPAQTAPAQPSAAAARPSATQPQTAQPQTVQPPAAQPQATQPPVTQPQPATQMTTTQPPSQEPLPDTSSARTREIIPPDVLLKRAQEAFEGGDIAQAIALLNQYLEDYPQGASMGISGGNDEIYWLLGQYYEANSLSRNILLSIDYYKRLVDEYPQSSRFNDARRRIAYLERYYINIQ